MLSIEIRTLKNSLGKSDSVLGYMFLSHRLIDPSTELFMSRYSAQQGDLELRQNVPAHFPVHRDSQLDRASTI